MNITRHNCESFFLDYYEKTLSPVEVAEVLFFLEENSDLKEVFEAYQEVFVEHEKINFPDKESLKKKYSSEEIDAMLSSEITRLNCEQFFIANSEGILSASQKEKLNLFLLQYPELKKEAKLFQQCKLAAEKIPFEGKESLKKQLLPDRQADITQENREKYFVRAIENDLNAFEQKELNLFLEKNPEYKNELKLFSKAILLKEEIYFEDKPSLKKRKRKPVFVSIFSQRQTYYAAAASVLLLVGLFLFFRNNETEKTFVADKINLPNKTIVNVKKESVEIPVKENAQKIFAQISKSAIHNPQSTNINQVLVKENAVSEKLHIKEEERKLQPIISEDVAEEKLTAEIEKPELKMQEEISVTAEINKKVNTEIQNSVFASTASKKSNDEEYQTLGSVVRKKIRSVLGIKNATECESFDKIRVWDLAMAAKNRVQKLIGTNSIDVNKICDGTGKKVEYVFAAGNFEFSKSASK